MPDFSLLQQANKGPTVCRFCGTHEGPFFDTGVDEVGYGHVWICAPIRDKRSGCVGTMAAQAGYREPREWDELTQKLYDAENELVRLQTQTFTYSLSGGVIANTTNPTFTTTSWNSIDSTAAAVLDPPKTDAENDQKKPKRRRRLKPKEDD